MEKERAQLRVKASDLTSFRFPIRQRFFIFTLLVSVVPLALVSRFFLEDTISRMNERTEGLLSKAAQVSQVIFISQSLPIQPSHFSADWLETHRAHFRQLAQIFPELVFRVFTVSSTNRVQLIYHSAPLALSGELPADLNQKMNGKAYLEKEPKVDWRTLLTSLQDNSGRSVGYLLVSAPNQTNLKDQYAQATSSFLFLIGLLVLLTTFSFNQTVIRPVNRLIEASQRVAQGDLRIRLSEHYPDQEMRSLMQNINQMLSQLEADQQMRTTFVSTLTHDLRTPLFAQRRVLEGIEKVKARYDEDLCFMLETAHKANDQVLEMVNKLLEAYQYEAGHIQIRSEAVSLFKLIDESFRALHPLAQAKQIRLENLVSPELTLKADPKQLQRVFQNLVSNAIANIQSEKTISVRAEADETEMIIRVQDNGPGIPTELLPHLFQRYFTGDSRQQIGSGLGLFICRMIVELHGGTITVESNPGIGTTFQITLLKAPPQPGD